MTAAEDLGTDTSALLGRILDVTPVIPPDRLVEEVAVVAGALGARSSQLYLADYEQAQLMPVVSPGAEQGEPLDIDGSLAGRAFITSMLVDTGAEEGRQVWVPLIDGSERLGVLGLEVDEGDEGAFDRCRHVASLVSQLLVTKGQYTDAYKLLRRVRPMSLAAEMQWDQLAPLTFTTPGVAVAALLEPAYEVGGDSFDYALNGDRLDVVLVDAMGHGLPACLNALVAIAAARQGRRLCAGLEETYRAMDEALRSQFDDGRFSTAMLARLDVAAGKLRLLNAGHPLPLLVRHGSVVGPIQCTPSVPVGLEGEPDEVAEVHLEPGDQVLFYTDGVVEGRSSRGELFGEARLSDLLGRAVLDGFGPAETARRLAHAVLTHTEHNLADDATLVLLEWRGREYQTS